MEQQQLDLHLEIYCLLLSIWAAMKRLVDLVVKAKEAQAKGATAKEQASAQRPNKIGNSNQEVRGTYVNNK